MDNIILFRNNGGDDKSKGGDHTGNGNPPGGGDLETRLINLERDLSDARVALGKVETRLESIQNNMLTKGQMAIYALIASMAVIGGGWWVVQQYLAPILKNIGIAQ